MGKKPASTKHNIAEAIVWAVFVITAGLASMSQLHIVDLTSAAQAIIGYVLGAYALLVFCYLVFRAVENKG